MQAEHMIKTGNCAMALHFVNQALECNANNRVSKPNTSETKNLFAHSKVIQSSKHSLISQKLSVTVGYFQPFP